MKFTIRTTSAFLALSAALVLSACGDKEPPLSPEAKELISSLQTELKSSSYTKEEKELIKAQIEEVKKIDSVTRTSIAQMDVAAKLAEKRFEKAVKEEEVKQQMELKKRFEKVLNTKLEDMKNDVALQQEFETYVSQLPKSQQDAIRNFSPSEADMKKISNKTMGELIQHIIKEDSKK